MNNTEIQQIIENKLKEEFALIAFHVGKSRFMTRPYISSTIMNISEDMAERYGKQLKMGYRDFLQIVETTAERLMPVYFK